MSELKPYAMRIDGPLFRSQRGLLLRIADLSKQKQPYQPVPGDDALLEGLVAASNWISSSAKPNGSSGALSPKTCATMPGCGSMWPLR